jgi:hypothetical protein
VVSAVFDAGVDGLLCRLRASGDPDARGFVTGFDNLLAVDGLRQAQRVGHNVRQLASQAGAGARKDRPGTPASTG